MSKDHFVHDTGKGCRQRTVDKKKFDTNYDRIFRREPQSVDAAYERKAMEEGLVEKGVFPENNEYYKFCSHCDFVNKADDIICKNCGKDMSKLQMELDF